MNWEKEYGVNGISHSGYYYVEHRGKVIKHIKYSIRFIDNNEIDVFVPHYFERLGTERRIIKSIEKNKLKIRLEKINKIKCTIKK